MRTTFDIDDNSPETVAWREQAIALFPNGGTAEERFACLHDIRVRDVVLWEMVHADDIQPWFDGFDEALNAGPHEDSAPVATAHAIATWMLGNQMWALLTVVTVLEAVDPDYSLARLVMQAISGGMPASEFVDATQRLTRHQCLHGLAYAAQVSA